MDKTSDKSNNSLEIISISATVFRVKTTERGVTVCFTAGCNDPRHGTGNDFKVEIEDISMDGKSIMPFLDAHEMTSILKYDMADLAREEIDIDIDAVDREVEAYSKEMSQLISDSYTW